MEHAADDEKVFGFWVYLMTDLVLFAVLFSAYLVLNDSAFGGPTRHQLFEFSTTLAETLLLLTSTFTCSLAIAMLHRKAAWAAIGLLSCTFVLGCGFLGLEISEFAAFVKEGATPQRSAFLSSFFTLVGTHGGHIFIGLLWMLVEIVRLLIRPLTPQNLARTYRLALFWHFLDVVWIFIFTVVYGIAWL